MFSGMNAVLNMLLHILKNEQIHTFQNKCLLKKNIIGPRALELIFGSNRSGFDGISKRLLEMMMATSLKAVRRQDRASINRFV